VIIDGLPLLELRRAAHERFVTRRQARTPPPPERDRAQQAAIVLTQIDQVVEQITSARAVQDSQLRTILVTAIGSNLGAPDVAPQLVSRSAGAELLVSDEGRVVFRIGDDLAGLRRKAVAYAQQDTRHGNPAYSNLVARIEQVALTTIADLSLGEIENDIGDEERLWVEIWTRGGSALSPAEHASVDETVSAFAALTPDGVEPGSVFHGPERDVHVVLATGQTLKALPLLIPDVAEVHHAPVVNPVVLAEAQDLAGEMAEVDPPPEDAVAIAIHDSGVDSGHPYVAPILLGAESVVPGEVGTLDTDGHGTQMAGVAAYARLADGVAGGLLHADNWLVSVRLLDSVNDAGGDPERGVMWAERTTESVAVAEAIADDLPVIHNISIGADNPSTGRLDRTSWSVGVDLLAWNQGHGRLLVVAGGNADPITDPKNYPHINLGPPFLQQPGQAWNVLTVGGYTELVDFTTEDSALGYPPALARGGELSPHSRTAIGGSRPIKPDIVMEAGNTAPGGGLENPEAQGLSILTLRATASGSSTLLRRTYQTSPAAAAASNALGQIATGQPFLRPATWRGLLVNTTRWPDAAIDQFHDRRDLLRSFGYGVPNLERAASSDSNRPVMVYEGSLRPSQHLGAAVDRRADFIEIPFPEDELHAIGDSLVHLAVTLSYFVEPTDNLTRRAYAGGRLRWDLQGPTETADSFRARINRLVLDEGVSAGAGSYPWDIPADERSRGTLQHGRAAVAAADIAGTRLLAVYPVLGWWEDSREGWDKGLPYSLVVSADLGEVDVELHALVAQSLVPIELPASE